MPIVASSPDPRVSFGPLADRPAATADGVKAGDRYDTNEAWPQRSYEVRLNASGTREWVELLTTQSIIDAVPDNLTIYVSTTGSDSNDGLTPGTALATLGQALKLAGIYRWTGTCIINLAAGVYNMPTHAAAVSGGLDGTHIRIPQGPVGGVSRTALPPQIRGAMATQANDTVAVVTTNTAPTFSTLQLTTGGYAVNQFLGMWARVTSGTRAGDSYCIASNTANTLNLCGTYTAGNLPAPGDTLVIEDNATTLRWTAANAQSVYLWADQAWIDAVRFESEVAGGAGASLIINCRQMSFTRCSFGGQTQGGWAVSPNAPGGIVLFGSVATAFADATSLIPTVFAQYGGCRFRPATGTGNASNSTETIASWTNSLIANCNIFASGAYRLTGCSLLTAQIGATGSSSNGFQLTLTGTQISGAAGVTATFGATTFRAAVLVASGASAAITNCDISLTGNGGDGICAVDNAHLYLNGVVSSAAGANAGFGVQVRKRSHCYTNSPNVNQTITGATGAVKVGNNGADTWANIAGGLNANITDLAQNPTEMCLVAV